MHYTEKYITIFNWRLIFKNGKYVGYYKYRGDNSRIL